MIPLNTAVKGRPRPRPNPRARLKLAGVEDFGAGVEEDVDVDAVVEADADADADALLVLPASSIVNWALATWQASQCGSSALIKRTRIGMSYDKPARVCAGQL